MPSASAPQSLVRPEVSQPRASMSAIFWRLASALASAFSDAATAAASLSAYSFSISATSYLPPQKSHSSLPDAPTKCSGPVQAGHL